MNIIQYSSKDIFLDKIIWTRSVDTIDILNKKINQLKNKQDEWKKLTLEERMKILLHFSDELKKNRSILAKMICEEVGRCLRECEAEIDKSLMLIDYYAQISPMLLHSQKKQTQASVSFIDFEPLGLVFAVMPWNYPVWQILRFAIPAMCAGNACLVKPAPTVGRVTDFLVSLAQSMIPIQSTYLDDDSVEQAIVQADAFAFTGSVETGQYLASISGKYLKKTVLELGGSNPFIVLKDADVKRAAKDACYSRFRDAGQSCNAAKRIIIVPEIAEQFIEYFLEECADLKIGNPMLSETTLGPLHLSGANIKLQKYVEEAISQGAECLLGGYLTEDKNFYLPTVLDYVSLKSSLFQKEIFGPIAPIFRARDESDAIKIANQSQFGLGASIYTEDNEKVWEYAKQLEVGSIYINRHTSSDIRLPFGGVKNSGYGRELSEFGLYEFVNIKTYWKR